MHLHGFHFRVDALGNGIRDTIYDTAHQRLAVTEMLRTGATMQLVWVPTRAGNWIFHCHFAGHIDPAGIAFDPRAHDMHAAMQHDAGMPAAGMAGLVLGIRVMPPYPLQAGVRIVNFDLNLFFSTRKINRAIR